MTKKVAIIGSSDIANYHVDALKKVGLNVAHCASSLNSKTVGTFADQHQIDHVWSDPEKLIKADEKWDGIVIAASTASTLKLLNLAMASKKPILVEKPICYDPSSLSQYSDSAPANVVVGYNRRHYSTVQEARSFVLERRAILASMNLPECVSKNDKIKYQKVFDNSVHGLDILSFVFGDLSFEKIVDVSKKDLFFGRKAFLRTKNNSIISLNMNWGAPSNFSLTIDDAKTRLDLLPFEKLNQYQGMDIVPASDNYPVRQYVPKLVSSSTVFDSGIIGMKPGFVEQAKEFFNLINGLPAPNSATLTDAYNALYMADAIVNVPV